MKIKNVHVKRLLIIIGIAFILFDAYSHFYTESMFDKIEIGMKYEEAKELISMKTKRVSDYGSGETRDCIKLTPAKIMMFYFRDGKLTSKYNDLNPVFPLKYLCVFVVLFSIYQISDLHFND